MLTHREKLAKLGGALLVLGQRFHGNFELIEVGTVDIEKLGLQREEPERERERENRGRELMRA